MSDKSKTDLFVEHVNSHILPFIDYSALQASYDSDMVYAKGILNRLHEAMVTAYGSERLSEMHGDDGFVVIPGVVCGRESGKTCLALLELDLSSSGEHWGTSYLCKYGVISQDGTANNSVLKSEIKEINAAYIPYDYGYTAIIPGDIHVDRDSLPDGIKGVLDDFKNHRAALQFEGEQLQGAKSMEYYGIWAVRGGGSVLGHAEAWSKRDGVPEVFTAKVDAVAHVERYNKSTASVHVRYYVKEMEPELAKSALLNMEKAAAANNRAAMLEVIGQFEKSRNLSDRNRMTWFHNDFGEFRANPGVTDEQIAVRYGEVLEMKLEREQKRSAAAVPDNVHGYEIKRAVCFDNNRGFALAENPGAPSPAVTWQFTEENGKREYYWGHYFAKVESAEKDFGKRVSEYQTDYPTLTEKYNYLAAAEMSTEQNYNMLDGRINNVAAARADLTDGQTYEEIKELAPETLPDVKPSVTEKLEAAKQAVKDTPKKQPRDKKPCDLERG